jgi:hypothetical protein
MTTVVYRRALSFSRREILKLMYLFVSNLTGTAILMDTNLFDLSSIMLPDFSS